MSQNSYNRSSLTETSTVCSIRKEASPELAPSKPKHRSLRQRIKNSLRNIGHPPTYRYDLEHGIQTPKTVLVGPMGSNVLNQPLRI
ncbi:hypothetical protein CSPAE12_11701 [Colletotrichum incanum]|nr:hypothetical protein CSPAE12_11701 [Colletotrichum incanum]